MSMFTLAVTCLLLFSCSFMSDFVTPWTAACRASPSFTISQSFLKLMSIKPVMLSNHLVLCHPLLLLPSIFPSNRVFSNPSVLCIRWSKYWSFSISPSNEYSGLISFRIDWFDLLAVQGTLKSLLQHHRVKASFPWHSIFFMVQLSHPYMTTGKIIALTKWTFISKVTSLLFNTLSRFYRGNYRNFFYTSDIEFLLVLHISSVCFLFLEFSPLLLLIKRYLF